MTTSTAAAVAVRFSLYVGPHLPLRAVAERVSRALALPLERRAGPVRGVYYRWTGDAGADVLVQGNTAGEDGALLEPGHPDSAVLVYATGLDDAADEALARVEGLQLAERRVLLLDPSH